MREGSEKKKGMPGGSAAIVALEAYLRRHPRDAGAHVRLALLYEHFCADPGKARDHYLTGLVRALGYPDAPSAEEGLAAQISRPDHEAITHIHLGQLLAYEGRFREAEVEIRHGTVWSHIDTGRFRVFFVPGSTADKEKERIGRLREESLGAIERIFSLRFEGPSPIVHYLYESSVHKRTITTDGFPGHVFAGRAEVHAVYGPTLRIDTPHEDVHVVLGRLGAPPMLFQEGAAEYASWGDQVHLWWAESGFESGCRCPSVSTLLDDGAFEASSSWLSYPMAASFVGFLIHAYGAEVFKRLYASEESAEEAVHRAYSKGTNQLEAEWRSYIAFRGSYRSGSEDGSD